jgi:hypothetical protein
MSLQWRRGGRSDILVDSVTAGSGDNVNVMHLKIIPVIISGLLGSMALPARAQEAADIDLQAHQGQSKDQATASPSEAVPTPSATVPELSEIDEVFKRTSLGKEADELKLHLEWRQLANRVVNDPEIVAAKKSVALAHTDLEKRQRLRAYYNIYYGKMRALAGSAEMKAELDAVKTEHLSHINQPRVRHLTDGSLPTPTPAPRKHRK